MSAKLEIEYRPRKYSTGRGMMTARGDREIWIAGEKWGHLESEGGRYRRLKLFNAKGSPVYAKPDKGDDADRKRIQVVSKNRWGDDGDRSLLDLAEDVIRAAIKDGRLVEPSKIAAQLKAHQDAMTAAATERDRRRDLMRNTLLNLWQNESDVGDDSKATLDIMEGLELAYEEIFCAKLTDQFVAKKVKP